MRVYVIDQDEQQEYAGRFCAYLQGSSVPIRTLAEAEAFAFDQVANPDVVVWDLHESDEQERGAIFAELKAKLCAYQLAGARRRCALVVDEAITVTEDDQGRRALGDLARHTVMNSSVGLTWNSVPASKAHALRRTLERWPAPDPAMQHRADGGYPQDRRAWLCARQAGHVSSHKMRPGRGWYPIRVTL